VSIDSVGFELIINDDEEEDLMMVIKSKRRLLISLEERMVLGSFVLENVGCLTRLCILLLVSQSLPIQSSFVCLSSVRDRS
jgi:hypothetical protein